MNLPPVLLLPGMMLDHRVYAGQLTSLSRTTEVLVGNITGFETIAEIAVDVLRSAPPRFALVGLSMGGIVAFEIWRQAAERVTHLALLGTTPYVEAPERQTLRLEQLAMVETGKLRDVMVNSMKPLYLAKRNRTNGQLVQQILDMALAAGSDVFRRQSLALRNRAGSTETLQTITCPALVLCGREDALCPVDFHATMASAIPGADLQVLAGCGHLSTMEEPAAVASALQRLLKRST